MFLFATIPPLYLSWVALFGFLFFFSLRRPKYLVLFLVLSIIVIPLLVLLRNHLTVATYNVVKTGSPEELKSLFRNIGTVVLVDHAMADAIAHTQLSPNEKIVEWEEVIINGTPYWIFAVTPLNTMTQNYVSKLILVHVQKRRSRDSTRPHDCWR